MSDLAQVPSLVAVSGRPPNRWRALLRSPSGMTGLVIVVLLLILSVVSLLGLLPYDPIAQDPPARLQPPSGQHWFGTDQFGRDVFSRVAAGVANSALVAIVAVTFATVVGTLGGLVAGFIRGVPDVAIGAVTNVLFAFPPLLLALAFATVLPANLTSLTIAIAISWWPWYTRLVRGQAASVAGRPYVEACRALGIPSWRILLRHVLPNSVTPVIVQVSLDVGGVILTASALSFLGLGAQDPTPDWGLMVAEGQNYFTTQWWLVTFPGLAILITALAFNLLGDGLRDVLDPRRVLVR